MRLLLNKRVISHSIILSFVLNEHAKGLVLHLQVDDFSAVEEILAIIDAVTVILLLRLVLKHVAEAMEVATGVNEGVMVPSTANELNLTIDALSI